MNVLNTITVSVDAIGLENGYPGYLQKMVNNADKQAFYFRTFQEFAELSVFLRGG